MGRIQFGCFVNFHFVRESGVSSFHSWLVLQVKHEHCALSDAAIVVVLADGEIPMDAATLVGEQVGFNVHVCAWAGGLAIILLGSTRGGVCLLWYLRQQTNRKAVWGGLC